MAEALLCVLQISSLTIYNTSGEQINICLIVLSDLKFAVSCTYDVLLCSIKLSSDIVY